MFNVFRLFIPKSVRTLGYISKKNSLEEIYEILTCAVPDFYISSLLKVVLHLLW